MLVLFWSSPDAPSPASWFEMSECITGVGVEGWHAVSCIWSSDFQMFFIHMSCRFPSPLDPLSGKREWSQGRGTKRRTRSIQRRRYFLLMISAEESSSESTASGLFDDLFWNPFENLRKRLSRSDRHETSRLLSPPLIFFDENKNWTFKNWKKRDLAPNSRSAVSYRPGEMEEKRLFLRFFGSKKYFMMIEIIMGNISRNNFPPFLLHVFCGSDTWIEERRKRVQFWCNKRAKQTWFH